MFASLLASRPHIQRFISNPKTAWITTGGSEVKRQRARRAPGSTPRRAYHRTNEQKREYLYESREMHRKEQSSECKRLRNKWVRGEGAAALAQTRFESTRKNRRNIMHILRIFSRPFESMYGPNERCHRPKPLISQPLRDFLPSSPCQKPQGPPQAGPEKL
jgi:hypothetical protein